MADNDHKGDIKLTGAQETLMLTLIARARDTESAHPILNDTYAASVAKQVKDSGYDFSKRLRYGLLERPVSALISLRTRILDLKTEAFLSAHPGRATVLHLACGLDSRSLRVRWQGEGRLWVDVDKQDVIELRKRVMRDPTAGSGAKARKPLYDYKRNSYAKYEITPCLRGVRRRRTQRRLHVAVYSHLRQKNLSTALISSILIYTMIITKVRRRRWARVEYPSAAVYTSYREGKTG
ncbi:hypothetical protein FJTKL_02326 [Diaporthe vaccinii]|uniref:Uncharacterized protein n=1 Tax=Diaporthe vaccinii TaxID=105482 RepID=A0ABR4F3P9_9PEZI